MRGAYGSARTRLRAALSCGLGLAATAAFAASAAAQNPLVSATPSALAPFASPAPPSPLAAPRPSAPPLAEQQAPLSSAAAAAEAARLGAALLREVPGAFRPSAAQAAAWIAQAQAAVARSDLLLDRPQLVVVVDRNPAVQSLCLVLARPDGPWQAIGGTHVSTGQPGRFDHYITPVGVFQHNGLILDFRAEGTFNENHIRGLGLKGMRVWDFGWQWATKGWRADGEGGNIRLLMHATDPTYLEHRIGRQASSGCVRIPAALNRFLDRHGVLDAEYEAAARDDIRYRALLMPDRTPTPLAGTTMVVIDTAAPAGPSRLLSSLGGG